MTMATRLRNNARLCHIAERATTLHRHFHTAALVVLIFGRSSLTAVMVAGRRRAAAPRSPGGCWQPSTPSTGECGAGRNSHRPFLFHSRFRRQSPSSLFLVRRAAAAAARRSVTTRGVHSSCTSRLHLSRSCGLKPTEATQRIPQNVLSSSPGWASAASHW